MGEETIMGTAWKSKICITNGCTRSIYWIMQAGEPPSDTCGLCRKYGFPNEKHNLPYPCKTCGQNFEVEHVTSPKGSFKTGKFVNCKECREKKQ